MLKYLIDTSFLLRLVEQGALRGNEPGEFASSNFVLIRPVKSELEALARRQPRARAKAARRALEAAVHLVVVDTPKAAPTDEALVQVASQAGYGVATLDQHLRRRLRALGVPVLSLRGGRPLRESAR